MSLLGLALLLCVTVDASNPLLPGTVRLDPSQSIQALAPSPAPHGQPTRAVSRVAPGSLLADQPAGVRPAPTLPAGLARRWSSGPMGARRHHAGERAPARSAEDH